MGVGLTLRTNLEYKLKMFDNTLIDDEKEIDFCDLVMIPILCDLCPWLTNMLVTMLGLKRLIRYVEYIPRVRVKKD